MPRLFSLFLFVTFSFMLAACGGGGGGGGNGATTRASGQQLLLDTSRLQANCQYSDRSKFSGTTVLPPNCLYRQFIKITESNTTLDCNGSIFDGEGQDKIGLHIDSGGRPLSNITVKNCTFRNFKGGIRISWAKVDSQKAGSRDELYRNSPTQIMLDNVTVANNDGEGIYVDDYVTNVTIQNSLIQDSKGVGIYLEHSSKQNHIVNNKLIRNGYRVGKGPREAIAVDSSAENRIEHNYFESNAAGAIFLYKNCGEHIDSGTQVIRWQHSDNNVIRNNQFNNEEVSIWLASRQSRNLSNWTCGDPPMDGKGWYFEDFADQNEISGNHFSYVRTAIRIEGDYNRITDNTFACVANSAIEMPHTMREVFMQRAQTGNVIERNQNLACQ